MIDTVFRSRKALPALCVGVSLTIMLVIGITPACAHKVKVFAYIEGEKVIFQGYFGGKAKAKNCVVEIHDLSGNKIQTGKTDSNGIAEFALKALAGAKGDLMFILEAGEGHRAQYTLKATELSQSVTGNDSVNTEAPKVSENKQSENQKSLRTEQIGSDELTKAVQAAVHKEIEPLIKMIGSQQRLLLELQDKGPSLESIVGGIGWILGLVGIIAYGLSRKSIPGN